MADKIHGKLKDWPHFDTIHLGSDAYSEGYDRIFGGKKAKNGKTKKHETRRGRQIQKARRKAQAQGREES